MNTRQRQQRAIDNYDRRQRRRRRVELVAAVTIILMAAGVYVWIIIGLANSIPAPR